jgi:4-amino-4-deoxy-L-arabinose transferase-like glycosyltransferase
MSDLASPVLRNRSRVQSLSWTRLAPHGPILGILSLSAILNCWALGSEEWGNAYYSAAVRSMMQSWHNFVFASFEPGGFVSVDKPPLSLWVQTISAKVFGFHPMSLLVPQALAGVLSVWFVYRAVLLVSSRSAALIAALVLAITPINVVVSHSNNLDAVLVCVMSAAAWAGVRAGVTGRFRSLAGASVLAGLAMTAKMLAGMPVMPGIIVAFLWCAPLPWRRRVLGAAFGAALMAATGLAWFAFVDLTPAAKRPFVGSSATNSAFQLAFERNGANQVDGTQGGFGGGPGGRGRFPGPGAFPGQPGGVQPGGAATVTGTALGGLLPGIALPSTPPPGFGQGRRGGPGGGFGLPRLGFSGGSPGPARLANTELGSQIAWFLPLSLAAGVLVVVRRRLRPSPLLGATVVFGGWFLIAAGAFSITKGIVHPYYLSNVGPPAAALVGLGWAELRSVLRERRPGWLVLPLGALIGTALVQRTILRRPDSASWRPWLAWLAIGGAIVGAGALIAAAIRSSRAATVAGLVSGALLVTAPLLWTQSSLAAGVTPQLPYAQATGLDGGRAGLQPNGGFTFPVGDQKRLVSYLRTQRTSERWLVAVQSAGQAESIIITSGEPVMTIGGFIGTDQIITEAQLRTKIAAREIRFFLVGSGGFGRGFGGPGSAGASSFVTQECSEVPSSKWQSGAAATGETAFPGGPLSASFTLYDCWAR